MTSPGSASAGNATVGLPKTLEWVGGDDGFLRLLDQTRLPRDVVFLDCRSAEQVHAAIQRLSVRGAPAIGLAGAFGVCLGAREWLERDRRDVERFLKGVDEVSDYVGGARPTAVNLVWAVRQVREAAYARRDAGVEAAWKAMLETSRRLLAEDVEICRQIGLHGADLIRDGMGVLTHCNAGALATAAHGTALSVMYAAHAAGRRFHVYADETRPLLQGARLTAFELTASGIPTTVLCDNMAGWLMSQGRVQLVIVGADRIAANGDTANKIGTYGLAVLAKHHGIPFYVAAPRSTFDRSLSDGRGIPIEQRGAHEVRGVGGSEVVAAGAEVYNPAFDVTPASLISGIITERGRVEPVTGGGIAQIFA
jgi:methylthioribose-1-phosphate isomerase